jgi:hypothetical protein
VSHDFCCDGSKHEVSTPKVHYLKACTLQLGYVKNILEMLVEDIEKTVRETPQEEEGDH